MVLFPDLLFWVYFFIFPIVVFIAFFIPGDIFLKKYSFSFLQRFVLGTCLGMVMWGWQGYIFGYLNMRWMSYVYLMVFFLLWVKPVTFNIKKIPKNILKNIYFPFVLIVLIGSLVQLSSVWFAGINRNNVIYFNSYSIPDNIWYIELTNEVIGRVPPFEPGMSGKTIENYHYWSNLVMAETVRIFMLPLIPTVSQYFPLLLSIFLGLTIVIFGQILNLKKSLTLWILFFVYFGGDFVNAIQVLFTGKVDFSQQSMEDGAKFLANPPRAFALVLFFAGLDLLAIFVKSGKHSFEIIAAFILGSLIGFKVYVGMFALIGLFFLTLYYVFTKEYKFLLVFLTALFLSMLIYMPINSGAGGLIYVGFWRAQDYATLPTLGLIRLELARQIFAEHGNWIREHIYNLLFLIISTVGTFGTKIIGLFQTRETLRIFPKDLNIFLTSGLIVNFILGTFFIQKSGGSNAFNFLVSVFVISSVYAGISCWYWLGKVKSGFKYIFIAIIIVLTIPRSINQLVENISSLNRNEGYVIGESELGALRYLNMKTEPLSLILTQQNSTFLNFIANRQVFLYSEGVLESHNIDVSGRVGVRNTIFNSSDMSLVSSNLLANNIDYIYRMSDVNFPLYKYKNKKFFNIVYEKNGIQILRVNRVNLL